MTDALIQWMLDNMDVTEKEITVVVPFRGDKEIHINNKLFGTVHFETDQEIVLEVEPTEDADFEITIELSVSE